MVAGDSLLEEARHDLDKLYDQAESYRKLRQGQANTWYTARTLTAPLAAALAAVAGFAGLTQLVGSTTAGILALAAAALGAALTALNPVQKANDFTACSHRWCQLAHRIDLARKFELTSVHEDARSLESLVKKHDDAFCHLQRGEYGLLRDKRLQKHLHDDCPGGPGHSWRPQTVWASSRSS